MMTVYVNDIFSIYNIQKNEININVVKAILIAMEYYGQAVKIKQKIMFDEKKFEKYWHLYQVSLNHFDPNYNRKTDFSSYFKYIIDSLSTEKPMRFHALFCPGYSRYGYKDHLGNTTIWKLEELKNLKDTLNKNNISTDINCYYSDVFLENCNSKLEPNWKQQMEYNRELFHIEARKYFDNCDIKNMSDIDVFSKKCDVEGYVDNDIIASIPKRTYESFKKGNEKFYKSLNFTDEQMNFRNDRLITMYRIFSDYLNSLSNSVFLPMENMYERENIFSENNTCTMYLKLKR